MANKSATMKLTLKVTSFIARILLNVAFYTLVVVLIINFSKLVYDFTYQLYGPVTVSAEGEGTSVVFSIDKGESTMDVASKLEVSRLIKNKYAFYLKTKLGNHVIMPGAYELSTDMTYSEILGVITDYSNSIHSEKNSEKGSD
ncbi:MAG TPA: endolytic transglycosylase MltG [Clostridiales bacterium]|nr:endolytic transglycosylase MltG [Clostridiales bacterium]